MLLAVLPLALTIAGILFLWYRDRQEMVSERALWASERRELLNRIQAPQFVPGSTEGFVWPESEDGEFDEIDLVGSIAEPAGEGE